MSARVFSSSVAMLAVALAACASAPPPKPRFPSAQAVAQLAAEPVSAPPDAQPIADVPEWRLTGPLPEVIDGGLHVAATAWDRLLGEAAAGRSGSLQATEAAACAAREIGLFQAAQPGAPPPRLVRFIAARCGVMAPTLASGCRIAAAADGVPDEQVFASEAPAVKAALVAAGQQAGAETTEAGLWLGRKETHPLICWAVAPRLFAAQRATLVPDDGGAISIQGDLEDVQVEALVSAGPLGTRPCVVKQDQPPHVSLSCPVQRDDAAAWIDVTAAGADEVAGRPVLSLLVWPAGQPDDTYHRLSAEAANPPLACPSPGGAAVGEAVAGCINQVRQTAGARPLSMAGEQSRTIAALVPRLFVGLQGGAAPETLDQVSLGLRAGWQTNADLSYGQLAHAAQEGAADPVALVLGLLEHPLGRLTLLDKEARLLAVGAATLPGGGATGLVAATYRVVDNRTVDQAVYADQVLTRINAVRAGRGLPPIGRFEGDNGHTMMEADRLTEGRHGLKRAISDAAESGADGIKFGHVHGWTRETDAPASLVVPEPLLTMSQVAIGVGRYRPAGEPWLRYVVLLVAPHEKSTDVGTDTGIIFTPTIYQASSK